MHTNSKSRRPPPPPPEDDAQPPPVPFRPQARKTPMISTTKPPAPPSSSPPELPVRPGWNNSPPTEVEQDTYEDVSPMPPEQVNPRFKSVTATLPPAPTEPISERAITPRSTRIRTWKSSKEVGPNSSLKTSNISKYRERRITLGAMHRPDPMPDNTYEAPQLFEVKSSSNNHLSFQQRQTKTSENDDDNYESDSEWSDSEWQNEAGEDNEEPNDVYVCPEEFTPQVDECDYTPADPETPEIECDKKPFHNFTSPSQSDLKPIPGRDKPLIEQLTQMLKDKKKDNFENRSVPSPKPTEKPTPPPKPLVGPTPPPKPIGIVKPSALTATTAPASNTKNKEQKSKGSVSDDNASAGSVSSKKAGQLETKQKEKSTTLPGKITSPIKESKVENVQPSFTPQRRITPVQTPAFMEEIYDDGVSESDSLAKYDWFHGKIDRTAGNKLVQAMGKVGSFLIRESTKNADGNCFPYTLVIKTKIDIKNMRIRQRPDNWFAIGSHERADEINFPTLNELVDHHRGNHVRIFRQDEQDELVKLTVSPKKL